MAEDSDKYDFTDDESNTGNNNPFTNKQTHHKGCISRKWLCTRFYNDYISKYSLLFFLINIPV